MRRISGTAMPSWMNDRPRSVPAQATQLWLALRTRIFASS